MKISRENYEIWFSDWLDNNLTGRQTDELNAFLELNSDLRDEFNALASIKLEPEVISYAGKESLRKSPEQISRSQFELLCAARAENDLTALQAKEMDEMISSDNERRKTAEIYKRLKLHPADAIFARKTKLLRKTAGQKIIRMAIVGLSAAAVIALIVTTGGPRQSETSPSIPENNIAAIEPEAPSPVIPQSPNPENRTVSSEVSVSPPETPRKRAEEPTAVEAPEKLIRREQVPERIAFNVTSSLAVSNTESSLIASTVTYEPEAGGATDDNRSNVGRFLAQTFRSKVLDETSDDPLKGYEIAEVGINGINKLLGWEMALSRNNDENGEVKSVYFSSRMLKFNAPVKNNDVAE